MAKLADASDLGSGSERVWVRVPLSALKGGVQVKVKDHEGREFTSVKTMCVHWGVSYNTYYRRREVGWSLEDALTLYPYKRYEMYERSSKCVKCEDHLGQQFPSISEMCRSYGIDLVTFLTRLRCGWSREKALTAPIPGRCRAWITLQSGRTFQSVAEFSRAFSLRCDRLMRLQKTGYSFDEILEIEEARKRRRKENDISGVCEM